MNTQSQAVLDLPRNMNGNGLDEYYNTLTTMVHERAERQIAGVKVLMYHRVVEDREIADKCEFCIHKDEFQKQLKALVQQGCTPVTLNDYRLFKQGELLLPKKPVIITFDDGYLETFSIAYPLLMEYGMRAVVFTLGDRRLKTNIWDENQRQIPLAPLMENHHVQELHSKGFEIGSHTINHSNLQQLSPEDALKEVKGSKMILESLLGTAVRSFAYPFGSVNSQIKNYIKECDYDFACSVYSGPARFGSDPYEIRRINIHNRMTIPEFIMRLKTPFEYVDWAWWKLRQVKCHYTNSVLH